MLMCRYGVERWERKSSIIVRKRARWSSSIWIVSGVEKENEEWQPEVLWY